MKRIVSGLFLIVGLMSFQTAPKKTNSTATKPTTSSTANSKTASIDRGKTVYTTQCMACHQVDGGGVPNMNAPLNGAKAVVGSDKAKIITIVLNGLKAGTEIDGEVYNNNMAPHKELTDQQIADVLTYVRNSWQNKASAVTPAEVKAVRAKNK
jgi:mono/diheme cytochrome c family protein